MKRDTESAPARDIQSAIISLHNHRVILDSDLAKLYGVPVKRLIEQVKRNIDRFPEDFMFQLSKEETEALSPSTRTWGGRRKLPYAFTEHGAVMAANVLRSERAIKASIHVVRAFVQLKQFALTHKELAQKIQELERQVGTHDKAIVSLFNAIKELMLPPAATKKGIGFDLEKR